MTIAPPSPHVMTLFPAKLKIAKSPKVPTFCFFTLAPNDSAASSTSGIFFLFVISFISFILHGNPA